MKGIERKVLCLILSCLMMVTGVPISNYLVQAKAGIVEQNQTRVGAIDPNQVFEVSVDDADLTTTGELFKVEYKGNGWMAETGYGTMFYKGTDHYSNNTGATYEMKFIGHSIEIIASKRVEHATCTVYIDGVEVGEANGKLASGARQDHQSLFLKGDLEEKEHTLKVAVKTGTTGAIQLDLLKVKHKPIAPTGIKLDVESLSVEAGTSEAVAMSAIPAYATVEGISLRVENTELADVSEDGNVTGKKAGTTNLIASIPGTTITKTIPLTVTASGPDLHATMGTINEHTFQEDLKDVLASNKTSWSEVGWRGDILNSKIDLATRKAVDNVSITASDFKNGAATISSSQVEINWLKETNASIGSWGTQAPIKSFPDIIHKGGAINIAAKRVQSAWVNINIPKEAAPGTYTGTLTVNSNSTQEPTVLAYSFEVINLVQPTTTETGTTIQIWQHPFAVSSYYGLTDAQLFTEDHFKYMRASMEEYKEMGGRDLVCNIVEEAWNHQSYYGDPSMVKWRKKADGTFSYDYTWFDKWVEFNIGIGVIDPVNKIGQIKCYSIVPWGNQIAYFDEATNTTIKVRPNTGTQEWKDLWKPFLEGFLRHIKEKGWFDITYIAMDERPLADLQNAVDLIESIKGADNKSFKIFSAINYSNVSSNTFLDRIHDISLGFKYVKMTGDEMRNLSNHRTELGLMTTIYTSTGCYPSNFTTSNMVDNAWTIWYTLSQDTTGFLRWAWDNWVADPLTDVTYSKWEPGDGWFIYPVEKGTQSDTYFYKTPRYEMLKQGIRDICKAKYLMEKSATLRPQIDALVKSIKRPVKGTNGYQTATYATPADALLVETEVARMREGLLGFSRTYAATLETPETSVSLNQGKVDLEVGQTAQLSAAVLPKNATNKTVTWSSTKESVATVDQNGLVTAVAEGTASIIATTKKGLTAQAEVTVSVPQTVVDKTELQAELTKAKAIKKDGYTEESYQALQGKILEAEAVLRDAAAIEKRVEEIILELQGAVNALQKAVVIIEPKNGWIKEEGKDRFYENDLPKAFTWVSVENKWKYTDKDGFAVKGWVKAQGIWYYLNPTDFTRKSGWLKDDGFWYFLAEDGKMKSGWLKDQGAWYFLQDSGKMKTGWLKDKGVWYYLQSSGKMKTGWLKEGNAWYFLENSGKMKTGWLKDGGAWYYLQGSGKMKTGWLKDGGAWYYLQSSGKMKTGWLLEGGKWYFLKSSGIMATSWTFDGTKTYELASPSGIWTGRVR